MRKGIKILGKVVSTIAMLLIILPLLLSLVLHIPAVQNFAVQKAVRIVSDKMETRVAIGRIDIGIFGKAHVEGFYVEDYQQDTLLYVGRLDAYVTGFTDGIRIYRAAMSDVLLNLRDTPDGVMNIKQVVERLTRKDREKKGNFRLSIGTAAIDGMSLRLHRNRTPRAAGIDFADLKLDQMRIRIEDFAIDGAAIGMQIVSLSAHEARGFRLNSLSGGFYLNDGCIGFNDARILTEHSNLELPRLSLVGGSWENFGDFIGEVLIDAEAVNSTLSTDDLAWFAPSLGKWHTLFRNIDLDLMGCVADFSGECRNLQAGDATSLTATFRIAGLPDIRQTRFETDITNLRSTADDIDRFAADIGGQQLSPQVRKLLRNGGTINLTARFDGLLSDFNVNASLAAAVGSARCNLRVAPLARRQHAVRGNVATRNLRLGALLGNPLFDRVSASADIDGTVGRDTSELNIVGQLSQFGVNDYVYDSLSLDGRMRNKGFDGHIVSHDRNLLFDFKGKVDFNEEVPEYDFRFNLQHADLHALNVNRRDSVSVLSGRMRAVGRGRTLDDLNGAVTVADALYRYNDKEIETRRLTLQGDNTDRNKYVQLNSDFADITFRSHTSYRDIIEYLRLSMWKYLPMLYDNEQSQQYFQKKEEERDNEQPATGNAYSMLTVLVKNASPVADAISSGLQIADNSELDLLLNSETDLLSLRLSSDYIQHDNFLITSASLNAANNGDSLIMFLSTEDIYAKSLHITGFDMTGGAKDNNVQCTAGFSDTTRNLSGMLGFTAAIAGEEGSNGRRIDVRLTPSHLTRGDKTWQLYADGIVIDTAQVIVERFVMSNREQELVVDGIASRSRNDSLTIRLRNFDLEPFTQFADNLGYVVEGRTNGSAALKAALGKGEFTAHIDLDGVKVNNLEAPPLLLLSQWDFERNRAGIIIENRNRRDTLIQGFYDPSQVRYYAKIGLDSLPMKLLDPILTGVISGTSGQAEAQLTLSGNHRDASLRGIIRVRDLSTTVDYTQVTYTMPEAVISVENNRFMTDDVPLYDSEGNRGSFDLDLSLQHLSNISYDIWVLPEQMLVLNTSMQDNDLFYGKVYASGMANIRGDKRGVKMDITAQTEDNTAFFMPLSSKSNISYADFVVFTQPEKSDTLSVLAQRKLQFARKQKEKTSESADMDISLELKVLSNADFQLVIDPTVGDAIKARGEGTFNLQIRPKENVFEMYGDYTISEGSYLFTLQNIINKKFVIESGSTIQWTGKPMDAMLNIDAVYKLKASLQPILSSSATGDTENRNSRAVPVECVLTLTDRLTNPTITFDVKVPNADAETQAALANTLNTETDIARQFVSLLAMNSFYPDNASSATGQFGAMVSSATGLELLSNQVSNWLSSDDYNIIIRYRPKSELSSDEVDLGFSKSLIDNRLLVEVEGNYVIDNKQATSSNMQNFMGEAYVTWMIDRTGNLKLRGFTQTIDRFDENQGLQEHGIGIYYKEDFNNFKDLRQRIKARFTNKKRQARRAARKAEKAAAKAAETEAAAETETAAETGTATETKTSAKAEANAGQTAAVEAEERRLRQDPVPPADDTERGIPTGENEKLMDET